MDLPTSKPFSPNMLHSEKERWICIYPVYINSRVTRARGRKVSLEQGVDNPKHTEICMILQNLGLKHVAENKVYFWNLSNRVRYILVSVTLQKPKIAGELEFN